MFGDLAERFENGADVRLAVDAAIRPAFDRVGDAHGRHSVPKRGDPGAHRLIGDAPIVEHVDDRSRVQPFVSITQFAE